MAAAADSRLRNSHGEMLEDIDIRTYWGGYFRPGPRGLRGGAARSGGAAAGAAESQPAAEPWDGGGGSRSSGGSRCVLGRVRDQEVRKCRNGSSTSECVVDCEGIISHLSEQSPFGPAVNSSAR